MRKIIYTRPDGGMTVRTPKEGWRFASSITLKNGVVLKAPAPIPADQFLRGWPIYGAVAEWAETEDEFIARVRAKDVPANATNVRIVDASVIPVDRTFRDAWKIVGESVEHDMPMARDIQKDRLRAERAPALQSVDVDFLKALEAWLKTQPALSDALQKVMTQKQALRDVTTDTRIADAKTPEALQSIVLPQLIEKALGRRS